MLAYENRAPDVTLTKFKHRESQTCTSHQLKYSQTLSILLYHDVNPYIPTQTPGEN